MTTRETMLKAACCAVEQMIDLEQSKGVLVTNGGDGTLVNWVDVLNWLKEECDTPSADTVEAVWKFFVGK